MATWTKILPFIFIEFFAKRYCERLHVERPGNLYATPYRGVLIKVQPKEQGAKP